MYDDIIAVQFWQCGDPDCGSAGGWHQSAYWGYADGTYSVDLYGDGDHEPVDQEDLPTSDSCDAMVDEYFAWVAENGQDPLEQFHVKPFRTVTERWQFKWNKSLVGPVCTAVRRNKGPVIAPRCAPHHVIEWLQLASDGRKLEDVSYTCLDAQNYKPGRWNTFSLQRNVPRSDEAYTRDLKRAARRAMG